MSKLSVEKVKDPEDRVLPVFAEFDTVLDRIRERAHELFSQHGFVEGGDIDNWFRAEHEICWPQAELVEDDGQYLVRIALAGFEPKDISVTANPREIIVKATTRVEKSEPDSEDEATIRWSEFRREDVFRRVEMPTEIDVAKITATFSNGILAIKASKAASRDSGSRKVKVSAVS